MYRFQTREKRQTQITSLRQQFQEDREKLRDLKATQANQLIEKMLILGAAKGLGKMLKGTPA